MSSNILFLYFVDLLFVYGSMILIFDFFIFVIFNESFRYRYMLKLWKLFLDFIVRFKIEKL